MGPARATCCEPQTRLVRLELRIQIEDLGETASRLVRTRVLPAKRDEVGSHLGLPLGGDGALGEVPLGGGVIVDLVVAEEGAV